MNTTPNWLDQVEKFTADTSSELSVGQALNVIADRLPTPGAWPVPTVNSTWSHTSGIRYTVLMITNVESTKPEYPPTVVYQGPNGKLWSRPLSQWHRSMIQVPSDD